MPSNPTETLSLTRSSYRPLLGLLIVLSVRCGGVEPTLGSDLRNVEIKATLFARRALTVAAPFDGRVVSTDLQEGATVQAGQTVVTLSNPDVERDYELARAQTMIVRSRLGESGGGSRGDFSTSERAVRLVLENKRVKLERYRELHKTQDVSSQEVEDAENEYAWAVRDYQNQQNASASPSGGARSTLFAEKVRADAEEARARERRDSLVVRSPIPGAVTAVRVTRGQMVYARDPLADVADISTVEVRGEISPDLVRLVSAGTPVEVKVFTVPTRTFQGKVDHVVSMQTTSAGSLVVVILPNADALMRPNTPAKITVRF